VKIADNLRNGLFNAEELVGEEVINFYRFVFVNAFGVWIVVYVDISDAGFYEYVIETRMSQPGDARILFDFIEISEQIAAPRLALVQISVLLNECLEFLVMVHARSSPFWRKVYRADSATMLVEISGREK
jgi:hypothetical protein